MEQQKNLIKNILNKNILRLAIYIIFSILVFNIILHLNLTAIHAEKKHSTTEESASVTDLNAVLLEQYKKELGLVLPSVIDDPAYKLVFENPSKDKPVDLQIDGKLFKKVKSPFTLPNLALGTHNLIIKFTNKDGIPRTINLNLTVVPREPVISKKNRTLFLRPDPIVISGQAMAFAKVMVVTNGNDVQYTNVGPDGKWTYILKTPKVGDYHFLFFTYNNGIISKRFASLNVEYKAGNTIVSVTPTPPTIKQHILLKVKNYKSQGIALGIIACGFFLIWLAFKIRSYFKSKWETKEIEQLIDKSRNNSTITDVVDDLLNEKSLKQDKRVNSKKKGNKGKKVKNLTIKKSTGSKSKKTDDKKGDENKTAISSSTSQANVHVNSNFSSSAESMRKGKRNRNIFSRLNIFLGFKKHRKVKTDSSRNRKSLNKKKEKELSNDITEVVFGQIDKGKSRSRANVKNSKQKFSSKKTSSVSNQANIKSNKTLNSASKKVNSKSSEKPWRKNRSNSSEKDVNIDKKVLSKNEFLGLFKKSKK